MAAVATSGTANLTLPSDTEILITREFDAPARLVYQAYTTPELVRQWWHAKRGEVHLAEIDLRVGGKWRYTMDACGVDVAFHGEFQEIVPNERLVTTEVYEGIPDAEEHAALDTVTFAEVDGRTTLTILMQMKSKQDRDAVIESGMESGLQDALDLLERLAISLA
jgi:uncharacterized protein YndB with AHSA1/START domain